VKKEEKLITSRLRFTKDGIEWSEIVRVLTTEETDQWVNDIVYDFREETGRSLREFEFEVL